MNQELPDVQTGFRKSRGTRYQIANIFWIIETTKEFQKTSTSPSLTTQKPSTTNCGKFFKRWKYQTISPASWETCMQVKKHKLEPNMGQRTDFKLEKKYVKPVYCHPTYLTSMQSASCEMPGWVNQKLESRLLGKISKPQLCRWHHPNGRKWRGAKESLNEG